MILVIILIAFAFVGTFGMLALAEAQDFDRGTRPGDVIERYARRSALPLLLATGLILIVARYAPGVAQPPTEAGTVLLMLALPVGVILLIFIFRVVPAISARLARNTERFERLMQTGRTEEAE